MNDLAGRHLALDGVEEADELLMPVALHAAADDGAVEHVQGGEQRGRAVALVVVGHRAGAALLHRQAGLGAVERLDLALLVDRQHDRMRRRIDVEADDVLQLGGELRIVGELELAHPVRLQPMAAPDALHRGDADPGRLGHRRGRPVGRLAGGVAGRSARPPARSPSRRQGRLARRPRLVAQQPVDARLHEALLPAPDHRLALAGLPHDRHRAQPVGASTARSAPARRASAGCSDRRRSRPVARDPQPQRQRRSPCASHRLARPRANGEFPRDSCVRSGPLAPWLEFRIS